MPQCIDAWKDRIRRCYAKTGMEPVNGTTRLSLLLGMCPPQLKEAMETWLLTNRNATYPLVEQFIFDRIQQKVATFRAPMQTDAFGLAPGQQSQTEKERMPGTQSRWIRSVERPSSLRRTRKE